MPSSPALQGQELGAKAKNSHGQYRRHGRNYANRRQNKLVQTTDSSNYRFQNNTLLGEKILFMFKM